MPVARATTRVRNRKDQRTAAGAPIHERKRKPPHQQALRTEAIHRPALGTGRNQFYRMIDFGEKGRGGRSAALRVPGVGRARFGDSDWVERNLNRRHYRRRIAARASGHGTG